MRAAGAVRSVGAGAQGERVQHALDVVFLHRGEERFVRGGVVGEGVGGNRLDVEPVDVLGGDEFEAAVAMGVWWRFDVFVGGGRGGGGGREGSFPDHVADAVANQEEQLDDVGGEGGRVKGEGADFGDVRPERAVDAAAFDAEDDAEVDGDPFDFATGAAVGAPAVALVVVTDGLEQLGRVFLEAVAFAADVDRSRSDGYPPGHTACCVRRCLMMT